MRVPFQNRHRGRRVTLYTVPLAVEALKVINRAAGLLHWNTPLFGLFPKQVGRRINAAAASDGLREDFTDHEVHAGMANATPVSQGL